MFFVPNEDRTRLIGGQPLSRLGPQALSLNKSRILKRVRHPQSEEALPTRADIPREAIWSMTPAGHCLDLPLGLVSPRPAPRDSKALPERIPVSQLLSSYTNTCSHRDPSWTEMCKKNPGCDDRIQQSLPIRSGRQGSESLIPGCLSPTTVVRPSSLSNTWLRFSARLAINGILTI